MNGGIQRQLTGSDVPDGAAERCCYTSPSHPPVDPGVAPSASGSANPPGHEHQARRSPLTADRSPLDEQNKNSRLCGLFMTIVNGTLDESRVAYEEALAIIDARYGR
mgnify:CR=1 FL=1|jgi:hypothetical protein